MNRKTLWVVCHPNDTAWYEWFFKKYHKYRLPRKITPQHSKESVIIKRLDPNSDFASIFSSNDTLLVICSTNVGEDSNYDEAIFKFKAMSKNILALISNGKPHASDYSDSKEGECFPKALRFDIDRSGAFVPSEFEPIAADLRPQKEKANDAFLKLISGILGIEYGSLKQRDKKRRRNFIIKAVTVLTLPTFFFLEECMSYILPPTHEELKQGYRDYLNEEKQEPLLFKYFGND